MVWLSCVQRKASEVAQSHSRQGPKCVSCAKASATGRDEAWVLPTRGLRTKQLSWPQGSVPFSEKLRDLGKVNTERRQTSSWWPGSPGPLGTSQQLHPRGLWHVAGWAVSSGDCRPCLGPGRPPSSHCWTVEVLMGSEAAHKWRPSLALIVPGQQ